MIKRNFYPIVLLLSIFIASCDDTTDTIGNSVTNESDTFNILTDTFEVSTCSFVVDSILSRGQFNYLGHIKDPETGSYVTSNYTTQFAVLEHFDGTPMLPPQDSIVSRNSKNQVVADSCLMQIYFYSSTGDSLNPMKLTAYELAKPVEEGNLYYTNYSPETNGLLRNDGNQIVKNKIYTCVDLNLSDSARKEIIDKKNMESISIPLNNEYIDKEGVKYENYGTYLMRKFYENPKNFSNSYSFTHNICPGFYIKSTDGIGVMSEVYLTELVFYYRYESEDSIYNTYHIMSGTEEVMKTTDIINDKNTIKQLASDNTCTYLKTPAGIFTEITLPVDDIKLNHENDTITQAKIIFNSIRNVNEDNYGTPKTVMLLPKDSLYSFFENRDIPNNITSYIGNYDDTFQSYVFNNISGLITSMDNARKSGRPSENWNKAILVPVTIKYNSSTSSTTITSISNEMSLKSTRLVGGSGNTRTPVTISIIYSRLSKE